MLSIIKEAFSGPSKPAHKSGIENYSELKWEQDNTLKPYWEQKNKNANMQDPEYPRPVTENNDIFDEDGVLWDRTALIKGPSWERGQRGPVTGNCSNNWGGSNEIGFVSLDAAHDQNKDFHHMNENPNFRGNPYTVTEYDDGIDYYSRNDISHRPDMKTSDFAIRGHNRETNLNRRGMEMRADIEASFVPSRWKNDMQSIMPFDQLRDHSHGGKLYEPGDEPTNDDPLKPWYRPEEKTYEELYNSTKVSAEGRENVGLMGEKIFYHQKIHHLKRKDNDQHDHYDYAGYMKGHDKGRVDGDFSGHNRPEMRVLPDFEYFGGAGGATGRKGRTNGRTTGKLLSKILPTFENFGNVGVTGADHRGMVEGFSTKKHANRGAGRDTKGVAINRTGGHIEHFDPSTLAKIEKRPEKLFAVWNSRQGGNMQTAHRGGKIGMSKEQYSELAQTRRHEYAENNRSANPDTLGGTGGMVMSANDSKDKQGLLNKGEIAEADVGGQQVNVNEQGTMLRNDGGLFAGIATSIKNTLKASFSGQLDPGHVDAVQNRGSMVISSNTRDPTKKSEVEANPRMFGNIEGGLDSGMVRSANTKKETKQSSFEQNSRTFGNIVGAIQGFANAKSTSKKSKKRFVEGMANSTGAPVSRLSQNGYLLVNPEARETKRSQMVSNFFGIGFKDFGIVSHDGVRSIEWHKDRNRKAHVTDNGARNNAPLKGDVGISTDQICVNKNNRKQRVIRNQIINPQARSHHAMAYGGEGLVNRKGTNVHRKVERAVRDGEETEFDFKQPRFSRSGRDNAKRANRAARAASRQTAHILAACP